LDLNVTRFDKIFFETQPEDLEKSKKFLIFPDGIEDSVWLSKCGVVCRSSRSCMVISILLKEVETLF
jgi:hypothetical protein